MPMSLTCKYTTAFGQLTDVFIIQQLRVHDLQLLCLPALWPCKCISKQNKKKKKKEESHLRTPFVARAEQVSEYIFLFEFAAEVLYCCTR